MLSIKYIRKYLHQHMDTSVLLVLGIVIECIFLIILFSLDKKKFLSFVFASDSVSYNAIALNLFQNGTLVATRRTLGYPFFLYFGYLLGGIDYCLHVIVTLQFGLNLVFVVGFWKLINKLLPQSPRVLKLICAAFFFWASIGMAFWILTDFLAAFFFFIFLYGFIFWRKAWGFWISAIALLLATLTRPTFTAMPILIILLAWLVNRYSSKISIYFIVGYIASSIIATSVSISYQRASYGYNGPSLSFVDYIFSTLYYAIEEDKICKQNGINQYSQQDHSESIAKHNDKMKKKIALITGKPYSILSANEVQTAAIQILFSTFRSQPLALSGHFIEVFLKYSFVPVESTIQNIFITSGNEEGYNRYIRPILALLCLPVWMLSLIPPLISHNNLRWYYIFALILFIYTVGVAILAPFGGERMRFPVLAFILPIALFNFNQIVEKMKIRLQQRRLKMHKKHCL